MPPTRWPTEPSAVIVAFEKSHADPEAGALLIWAFRSGESLDYLCDLDDDYARSRSTPGSHPADLIDVAHARWATGTSITALDLGAAALARALGRHSGPREFDIGTFTSPNKAEKLVLARVPCAAHDWVHDVLSDSRYDLIKSARDGLTHRRLPRHLYASVGPPGPDPRLDLSVGSQKVPVADVIRTSRELATSHLEALLALLPQL